MENPITIFCMAHGGLGNPIIAGGSLWDAKRGILTQKRMDDLERKTWKKDLMEPSILKNEVSMICGF